MFVPNIVLNYDHRATPFLLRANPMTQISVVDLAAFICSAHFATSLE